jgi:multiple sugar transport system permease protein
MWSFLPLVWLFISSLSEEKLLLQRPPVFFPNPPMISNYTNLFVGQWGGIDEGGYGGVAVARRLPMGLLNSLIVASTVTILNLILGSLAGYAYSRYMRFWFMKVSFIGMLLTRMIPPLTLILPLFLIYKNLNLMDTRMGLIIAYMSQFLPLVIWILKGYFDSIPQSLERAAQVDGCTRLQSLYRVILPNAAPGLFAAGIFNFVLAWNEFQFALLLTRSPASRTVTGVLSEFSAELIWFFEAGFPSVFAAGVVAVLPPVLLAFLAQRYLIQGMLAGSSKG